MQINSQGLPVDAGSSGDSTVGRYRLVVWLLAVLALGIILWNARRAYFVFDDWTYWVTRQDFMAVGGIEGTLKVLFVPHNGQLPTLTFLLWLPLDWLFGMHTYIPYLLPAVLVHVITGVLLFELLARRLGPKVAFADEIGRKPMLVVGVGLPIGHRSR